MADILKISTPLVDRNQMAHQGKPMADPTAQFQMSETQRVVKSNPQSELLQQNNGMPTREDSPAILMNLLRDPAVTVSFLRNIYLLQEIIGLIPQNNEALTQELTQLYDQLMLSSGEIAPEMARQEAMTTLFRGELFDMLRTLLAETPRPDLRYAAANLLKSLNALIQKPEILQSLANNLQHLAKTLAPARDLSQRLETLAQAFRQGDAGRLFPQLKAETLQLLEGVKGSILYTPRLEKLLPMITYNLSRYSDNPDYLQDSANSLLNLLDDNQRQELLQKLRAFLEGMPDRRSAAQENGRLGLIHGERTSQQASRVMDALTKLIQREAGSEEVTAATAEKLEKIIHSLLSSPCNFTPLLHFIVPVEQQDLRAFAELWLDPNSEEAKDPKSGENGMHMLVVFDVEKIGQFEAELVLTGKRVGLNLFCPPIYAQHFQPLQSYAARLLAGTGYTMGEVYVGELKRSRSLMEVFKSLPHRRTGVDVKV